VLNIDSFPAGVNELEDENQVVLGFIKHNYQLFSSKVHFGILYRVVPGFAFVINQLIIQYLLKTIALAVLEKENGKHVSAAHYDYIYLLGSAYVLNFLFTYACDYLFAKLKLGGSVGLSLRSMCVDTVIQLTEVEAEEFDVGRIIKTNDRDVDVAIQTSWLACFNLCGNLIKIGFMLLFLCATSIDQARVSNTPSIQLLMLVPISLICLEVGLLLLSFKKASLLNNASMDADDAWSSFLAQISILRQSITNYR
jgi:hypothetical protein